MIIKRVFKQKNKDVLEKSNFFRFFSNKNTFYCRAKTSLPTVKFYQKGMTRVDRTILTYEKRPTPNNAKPVMLMPCEIRRF